MDRLNSIRHWTVSRSSESEPKALIGSSPQNQWLTEKWILLTLIFSIDVGFSFKLSSVIHFTYAPNVSLP
jgi:hypothetical protein